MSHEGQASLEALQTQLRQAGLRVTAQRAAVLRVLAHSEEHLSAEQIWEQAKAYDASINLATVYRTLSTLKELGIIDPRSLTADGRRRFYESAAKPRHYHFTCLGCGRVQEFESDLLDRAREQIARQHGFHITTARITFEGLCECCAQSHSGGRTT
jgi:Fur family ferric uptake transcriptional regulator